MISGFNHDDLPIKTTRWLFVKSIRIECGAIIYYIGNKIETKQLIYSCSRRAYGKEICNLLIRRYRYETTRPPHDRTPVNREDAQRCKKSDRSRQRLNHAPCFSGLFVCLSFCSFRSFACLIVFCFWFLSLSFFPPLSPIVCLLWHH